jgi:hypothetical protein
MMDLNFIEEQDHAVASFIDACFARSGGLRAIGAGWRR